MLSTKHQIDYQPINFELIQAEFNASMANLAHMQTDIIKTIPNEIRNISRMTESLSNIVIISGDCFFFKNGKDFKVLENNNIFFDSSLNILKLNPTLSYKLEPKQTKNKITTQQTIRVYDKSKGVLKSIDDLLIKNEVINIETREQRYQYTISLEFQELQNFNNLFLKLNEETLSYPMITEMFYVDGKRHKKNIKILNNDSYSYDIDLNKNSSNTYSLDFDVIEADNIHITLEDVGLDLILDKLEVNFTEYSSEGSITFEVLSEEFPILKVGLEGKTPDDTITYQVSHNLTDWYDIDLSNTYRLDKTNRVVSWNTVSPTSIGTEEDVRKIYLRIVMRATEKTLTFSPKVNRELHVSGSFNSPQEIDSYSVYELNTPIHYGEKSITNRFDFQDLYDNGEYLVINNEYYIKGFKETPISKINKSSYAYAPVTLKTKEKRVSGKIIEFPSIDISSKSINSYSIEKITKNLLDLSLLTCVIPLKEEAFLSTYYIKQGDDLIEIDLSTGYINSVLEVLVCVRSDIPVYLLDSFKNLVEELEPFIITQREGEDILGVSLLDSSLFSEVERYSRIYPIVPLKNSELGFIDNSITSLDIDRELPIHHLKETLLYFKDTISPKNINYTNILSEEDYDRSKEDKTTTIPSTTKAYKFKEASLVKGSVILEEL